MEVLGGHLRSATDVDHLRDAQRRLVRGGVRAHRRRLRRPDRRGRAGVQQPAGRGRGSQGAGGAAALPGVPRPADRSAQPRLLHRASWPRPRPLPSGGRHAVGGALPRRGQPEGRSTTTWATRAATPCIKLLSRAHACTASGTPTRWPGCPATSSPSCSSGRAARTRPSAWPTACIDSLRAPTPIGEHLVRTGFSIGLATSTTCARQRHRHAARRRHGHVRGQDRRQGPARGLPAEPPHRPRRARRRPGGALRGPRRRAAGAALPADRRRLARSRSSASRRCSAGATPSAAWSRRSTSSRWPRRPA